MKILIPMVFVLFHWTSTSVQADGEVCFSEDTALSFAKNSPEPFTYCEIIVAADASGVLARCELDGGLRLSSSSDEETLIVEDDGEPIGFYAASPEKFEAGVLPSELEKLLSDAGTCLATEDCLTGANSPERLFELLKGYEIVGAMSFDVTANPNALGEGLALGAGLESALNANPPLTVTFIRFGDLPALVWQNPVGSIGLPTLNVQLLQGEGPECPQ